MYWNGNDISKHHHVDIAAYIPPKGLKDCYSRAGSAASTTTARNKKRSTSDTEVRDLGQYLYVHTQTSDYTFLLEKVLKKVTKVVYNKYTALHSMVRVTLYQISVRTASRRQKWSKKPYETKAKAKRAGYSTGRIKRRSTNETRGSSMKKASSVSEGFLECFDDNLSCLSPKRGIHPRIYVSYPYLPRT
jgi:hypothetical protein